MIDTEATPSEGVNNNNTDPEPTPIKVVGITERYSHCFEIYQIKDGPIPVGGNNFLSDRLTTYVNADFESFRAFYNSVKEAKNKIDLPKLKSWLLLAKIDIEEELFAELFAFTTQYNTTYPNNPDRERSRLDLYRNKKELKLSDVFEANSAECAEVAALAQKYLQENNISSSYFSGDVLWTTDDQFTEKHSFIVIRIGVRIFIYDPANPIMSTQGIMPGLYYTDNSFDLHMASNRKKLVRAKSVYDPNIVVCFGMNNGTNIDTQKHIVG